MTNKTFEQGKFITIEGSEGAGKSTAIQYLRSLLANSATDVIFTREPGGTAMAEEIRNVLLYPKSDEVMNPETELLLMFAGRAQHLHHCILPALQTGKWVVSDRYVDASYAYQGGGRGLSMQFIQALDNMVVGRYYPDLTLLLDVPAALGFTRTEKRSAPRDRIEQEKLDFFERVRQVYLDRAKADPKRIKIIDASQSLDAVQTQIGDVLKQFFSSGLS
jgi:dTMP kinase